MSLSRRYFLRSSAALPLALRAVAAPAPASRMVLLGTDKGAGIYRASWNPATGEIGQPELAVATPRPTFLAMHPSLPVVYAANEMGGGKGAVSSFRVDRSSGSLTPINTMSSHGDGPCAVSADQNHAYVANYTGGSFAGYKLRSDGSLEDDHFTFTCSTATCGTPGPVHARQDKAHLHCATIAPSGHIVVCDLGDDSILVFNPPKDRLDPPTRYAARPGSGPRHVAFHPNGKWMYCIHELDCTIDVWDWRVHGWKGELRFREGSSVPTLADGAELEGNTAAEILVSDDGRFAYACTRGADEITSYTIDPKSGLLLEQQRVSTGGQVPRSIAFDPTRRWLVSCNMGSERRTVANLAVFALEPATGRLSAKPKIFHAETPMFIQWV